MKAIIRGHEALVIGHEEIERFRFELFEHGGPRPVTESISVRTEVAPFVRTVFLTTPLRDGEMEIRNMSPPLTARSLPRQNLRTIGSPLVNVAMP
jgi:hypothetical protein